MEDSDIQKKIGELNAEHNKLLHDVQQKWDDQLKGRVTMDSFQEFERKLDARWAVIESEILKLKRPGHGQETKTEQRAAERKAFETYIRKGEVGPEERKVLTVSGDTGGGYLAPEEYVAEIIKGIVLYSPIRTVARIRTTSQRSVRVPKRTGTFAAAWVSEIGTRSESTGLTYGLEEIPNHELYALVKISLQELEDSAFNMESEIAAECSEQFGVAEGTAFITGNKVGKPEGILSNASVLGNFIETAGSNVIAGDDLIGVQQALPSTYTPGAAWLMKRATVGVIRKIKESTTNAYMWQPGLQSAQPPMLLGSPVIECVDMPSGLVDNQYEVVYGNFAKGYLIVDRIDIAMLRDPYSGKTSGTLEISARKRVGGQVVLAEAIIPLKIKA